MRLQSLYALVQVKRRRQLRSFLHLYPSSVKIPFHRAPPSLLQDFHEARFPRSNVPTQAVLGVDCAPSVVAASVDVG